MSKGKLAVFVFVSAIAVVLCLSTVPSSFAQGGPPMLTEDRGRERARPHLSLHHAIGERRTEDSECVQPVPQGQDPGLGDRRPEDMAGPLALARCPMNRALRCRNQQALPLTRCGRRLKNHDRKWR